MTPAEIKVLAAHLFAWAVYQAKLSRVLTTADFSFALSTDLEALVAFSLRHSA